MTSHLREERAVLSPLPHTNTWPLIGDHLLVYLDFTLLKDLLRVSLPVSVCVCVLLTLGTQVPHALPDTALGFPWSESFLPSHWLRSLFPDANQSHSLRGLGSLLAVATH